MATETIVVLDQNHDNNHTDESASLHFRKGVKYMVENYPGMKKVPVEFHVPLTSNPLSVPLVKVPVVDLAGLLGTPEARASTIKAIADACASWGVFMIVNHGIEVRLMKDMIKVLEDFHGLSFEEKMKYASDDVLCYDAMCPARFGTSLNFAKDQALHWRDYLRHYSGPFDESFNLWPTNPPNYRDVAKEYLSEVWQLSLKLGRVISEGLGLDEEYLGEKLLNDGFQIMAANYYAACPEPEKTLGLAPHSDHLAFSVLMDNGVGGLQINHNGNWVAIDIEPGAFIINVGDSLEIFTNGRYKSIEHRGTVNREKARLSMVVGHAPNMSRELRVESALLNEGEVMKYRRPITYGEYLKLQQTTAKRGKTALEALDPITQ